MRKFILALFFGALFLPDEGFTLGLGDIQTNSALNQRLDADIALLSASPEDAEQLIVKLASGEEFSRAGIDRPYMLTSLRFKTLEQDGVPYIKVTSPKPIREPFLNFLLEIDWPQGHLLREYTILLDPPVYMGAEQAAPTSRPAASESRPAAVAAPAPVESQSSFRPAAAPAPQPVSSQQAARQAAAPAPQQTSRPGYAPDGYRVQAGDTTWSLADSLRPDQSVTVPQMMLAMLRTNPEVFINGNVNGLKRGYILRVPDYEAINSIDQQEALALVQEQNALWREYQQTLASGTPASSIEAGGQSQSGADVDTASDARLNIVSAGTGSGAAGAGKDPTDMSLQELRAELALASEQLETERVEKDELNARVQALQGQVDKMKRMLTIEDQSMAEMQEAAVPDVLEGKVPEGEASADIAADAEQAIDEKIDEMAGDAADAVEDAVDTGADAIESAADSVTEGVEELTEDAEQAVFMDEAGEETPVEQMTEANDEQVQTGGQEFMDTMPSDFVTPPKPDPLQAIMNNPIVLAVIAGGTLLFIGVIAFLFKRRKSSSEEPESAAAPMSIEDDLEDVADMVEDEAVSDVVSDEDVEESMAEAEAEEEEFDAESTMILPAEDTVVTESSELTEDAEEDRDDVIAEADVYLAYGIYQQAEELLQGAIDEHPDREAYRVKLAETHYAGKNTDAFIEAATALKEKSGTDSKGWAKVVAMGKDLCPDHDMFKAADMVGDVELDDLMPKVPEMDIDLEGGDDTATPDLDFSLDDDSALELPETDSTEDTAVLDLDDLASENTSSEEELEFDLSETDALEETTADAEEEFSLDIDAAELDLSETADEEESVELSLGDDAGEIDLTADIAESADELDIDMDLGDAAEKLEEETADVDLDLGLDTEAVTDAIEATTEGTTDLGDTLDDDLGDLGDVDEIATKLDLARAYLDMGDSEGTRSILDEVIADGNDEQKKEAQSLLDQLD